MKLKVTFASLALLTACQVAPTIDIAAETKDLMAADVAFAALSESSYPKKAFAAYMAANGMMLPRGSDGAIEGYEKSIAIFGEDGDPGYQILWQPQFAEVAASADMGWTWGQYQIVVDGEAANTGKYVNIWQKQPDGSWKVRVDIGNQRPKVSN